MSNIHTKTIYVCCACITISSLILTTVHATGLKRFTVIPILICILGTAMRNVFFSQKVKRYYQSNDLTFSTCPASFCSCYMVYCFLNQCWITKFVHFICYICYITTRILQLIICCYISNFNLVYRFICNKYHTHIALISFY
jgi:hypothetical protein